MYEIEIHQGEKISFHWMNLNDNFYEFYPLTCTYCLKSDSKFQNILFFTSPILRANLKCEGRKILHSMSFTSTIEKSMNTYLFIV